MTTPRFWTRLRVAIALLAGRPLHEVLGVFAPAADGALAPPCPCCGRLSVAGERVFGAPGVISVSDTPEAIHLDGLRSVPDEPAEQATPDAAECMADSDPLSAALQEFAAAAGFHDGEAPPRSDGLQRLLDAADARVAEEVAATQDEGESFWDKVAWPRQSDETAGEPALPDYTAASLDELLESVLEVVSAQPVELFRVEPRSAAEKPIGGPEELAFTLARLAAERQESADSLPASWRAAEDGTVVYEVADTLAPEENYAAFVPFVEDLKAMGWTAVKITCPSEREEAVAARFEEAGLRTTPSERAAAVNPSAWRRRAVQS